METGQINFPRLYPVKLHHGSAISAGHQNSSNQTTGKGGTFSPGGGGLKEKSKYLKQKYQIWYNIKHCGGTFSAAQETTRGAGGSGCCVAVSADDRRMGEGAPRDALFVTYPLHLPSPPLRLALPYRARHSLTDPSKSWNMSGIPLPCT